MRHATPLFTLLAVGAALGLSACLNPPQPPPTPDPQASEPPASDPSRDIAATPREAPASGHWGPCAARVGEVEIQYTYDELGRLARAQSGDGGIEVLYHPAGFVVGLKALGAPEPFLKLTPRPLAQSHLRQWLGKDNPTAEQLDARIAQARAITSGTCPAEQTLLLIYPFFATAPSYMAGRNYALAAISNKVHVVGDTVYENDAAWEGRSGVSVTEAGLHFRQDDDSTRMGFVYDARGCIEELPRKHYSGKYNDTTTLYYAEGRLSRFTTSPSFMVPGTDTALRWTPQGDLQALGDGVTFLYDCPDNTTHRAPER